VWKLEYCFRLCSHLTQKWGQFTQLKCKPLRVCVCVSEQYNWYRYKRKWGERITGTACDKLTPRSCSFGWCTAAFGDQHSLTRHRFGKSLFSPPHITRNCVRSSDLFKLLMQRCIQRLQLGGLLFHSVHLNSQTLLLLNPWCLQETHQLSTK